MSSFFLFDRQQSPWSKWSLLTRWYASCSVPTGVFISLCSSKWTCFCAPARGCESFAEVSVHLHDWKWANKNHCLVYQSNRKLSRVFCVDPPRRTRVSLRVASCLPLLLRLPATSPHGKHPKHPPGKTTEVPASVSDVMRLSGNNTTGLLKCSVYGIAYRQ